MIKCKLIKSIFKTYTDNDNILRSYGYTYDEMNRLKGSYYQKEYTETNSYDEHLTYDKNGNILTLNRNGFLDQDNSGVPYPIDNLTYNYEYPNKSNRLVTVADHTNSIDGFKDGNLSGVDYDYDDFGNMIRDRNKGIDKIYYNHLNLPTKIVFSNSSEIYYIYNAVGSKIRKRVVSATQGYDLDGDTHYISGFQYKYNKLQFFPTAEGYVNVTDGGKFNYVYNYTDHLGNVRLSYAYNDRTSELNILEENHYYPFGLKHSNYNVDKLEIKEDDNGGEFVVLEPVDRNKYQYKYNGKEYQDELNLNVYDYGARNYDPAIGRFMSIDPLAEKYAYNSTYAFQENKMGLGRELEGLEMTSERSKDGKSVTLTMKVNAVNKSLNINGDQYKTILAARIINTESALSGSIGNGVTVNAKVVVDPKATITMEFNDAIDPKGVKSFENSKSPEKVQASVDLALGVASEIGNTQVNKVQVNVPRNLEFDDAGIPIIDAKNLNYISNTGTHEDLHAAGLQHVDNQKNRMNYENTGGTQVTEEQRKTIIDNVEKQQPQ